MKTLFIQETKVSYTGLLPDNYSPFRAENLGAELGRTRISEIGVTKHNKKDKASNSEYRGNSQETSLFSKPHPTLPLIIRLKCIPEHVLSFPISHCGRRSVVLDLVLQK